MQSFIISAILILNFISLSGFNEDEISGNTIYGRVTTADEGETVPFINIIIEGVGIADAEIYSVA